MIRCDLQDRRESHLRQFRNLVSARVANVVHDDDDCFPIPRFDARFQRRGIGKEVIRLVLEYVRSRPGVRTFLTSYVPEPGGPGPFYRSLGFEPNGEVEDGEVVLVYPLLDGSWSATLGK